MKITHGARTDLREKVHHGESDNIKQRYTRKYIIRLQLISECPESNECDGGHNRRKEEEEGLICSTQSVCTSNICNFISSYVVDATLHWLFPRRKFDKVDTHQDVRKSANAIIL